jgi:hypothetical protein
MAWVLDVVHPLCLVERQLGHKRSGERQPSTDPIRSSDSSDTDHLKILSQVPITMLKVIGYM